MGDSGSQVLGFTLGALGLATSWKVAETTVATLVLPILVLGVPILDTALVATMRMVEGRPIHQGGKDHASHRLVRGGLSRAADGRPARRDRRRAGRDQPRLQRPRRLLDHARRRAASPSPCSCSSPASSSTSSAARTAETRSSAGGWMLRTVVLHRRRLLEVLVDFVLISVALVRRLRPARERERAPRTSATSSPSRCRPSSSPATSPSSCSASTRGSGATPAHARRRRSCSASPSRRWSRSAIVVGTTTLGDFPARVFVADALLCMLVIGASRFGERALFRARSTLTRARRAPDADRRRGPLGAEPRPRAPGDAGRAGRRLRRRRPAPPPPPAARRPRPRRDRSTSSASSPPRGPTRCW